jgi:hypothetical protein
LWGAKPSRASSGTTLRRGEGPLCHSEMQYCSGSCCPSSFIDALMYHMHVIGAKRFWQVAPCMRTA